MTGLVIGVMRGSGSTAFLSGWLLWELAGVSGPGRVACRLAVAVFGPFRRSIPCWSVAYLSRITRVLHLSSVERRTRPSPPRACSVMPSIILKCSV